MKKKHKSSLSFKAISLLSIILFGMSTPAESGAECRKFNFSVMRLISPFGQYIEWKGGIEVLATVMVDSVFENKVAFSVLSVAPVDTTIFINIEFDTSMAGIVSDTVGFPAYHVDSTLDSMGNHFTQGDTLRDIFIVQLSPYGGLRYWGIAPESKDCLLNEPLPPPFPLNQALSFFNQYLNVDTIYKGYSPPANGILKLGPVFNFVDIGDLPGWGLKAYNDSTYWYFEHYSGDGFDCCCMSCDKKMWVTYRISSDGTAERVSCTSDPPELCNTSIREKKPPHINIKLQGDLQIYDLSGRFIKKISSTQFRSGRSGMARLRLRPGVYIIKPENGKGQSLLHTVVY